MTNVVEKQDEVLVPAADQRFQLDKALPEWFKAMIALNTAAADGLDPVISELVRIRASQINGCAFCLDMHNADARSHGVPEHKLFTISAWRDTPFFTARERAALALAEAMTRISDHGVPDDVYQEAARQFDESELAKVMAMVITINCWNRISITTGMSPAPRPDKS